MAAERIQRATARRFVLGRQGLWPGRRWTGASGVASALRAAECVQIDPISVIHRSHDLTLASRVLDYDPAFLDPHLYTDRAFFDYGFILMIYPREDLPFMQNVMHGMREHYAGEDYAHHDVAEFVLNEIRTRGPMTSREFVDRGRVEGGFNTVKDTTQALRRLWIGGELMTHGRRGFDRIYDLFHNVAGSPFDHTVVTADETADHFARKALNDVGLANVGAFARRLTVMLHRRISPKEARERLASLARSGFATTVEIEGLTDDWYAPANALEDLISLEDGAVPAGWAPIGPSTTDETTFIAPLDNVVWDRARTVALFDFEYVWEVYKPAPVRRWGYYTLPILFEDGLVGRIDLKLDRKSERLIVNDLWLEEPAIVKRRGFVAALTAGMYRFMRLHGAKTVDLTVIEPPALRRDLSKSLPA